MRHAFQREKHGAPVRHAFQREKHGAPVRPRFLTHGAKVQKAVAESSSATADVSVSNLRSQTPTHHQVFWLMQPGAAEDLPKTPRAASSLLMGSRPQWPPFGAKPRSYKYSYGISPGLSPGFFYPRATQRSSARRVIQCIIFLFTIYHIYRTLSTFFSRPTTKCAAAAGASPKLPRRGHVTPGFVTLLR